MEMKRIALLGLLLIVLIILIVIFFRIGGEKYKKEAYATTSPASDQLPGEVQDSKKIILFFASEDDTFLHPEERDIPSDSSIAHQAKQIIKELINGSQNSYILPLPPETKLRELFITKEGIVYVDFSREIQEKHLSGSSAEILTIFSTVNSLAYNFKSIKRVFLLIEGNERETLAGHVDLSRPLLPRYDLIAD